MGIPAPQGITLGVPNWIVAFARILTPAYYRPCIEQDLLELQCDSQREYLWCSLASVARVIKDQMRQFCRVWLVVGEALFFSLPVSIFASQVPSISLLALLTLLLSLLRLRDAYGYPADGSASEMVRDAAFTLGIVVCAEAGFAVATPILALPEGKVILAAMGAVLMAQWRMIFRQQDPPNPLRRQLRARCMVTWHINALFVAASIPLALSDSAGVPGSHLRDQLLGALPILFMSLAWRLKKDYWRSLRQRRPLSVFVDPEIDEIEHQRATLPVRDRSSKFPSDGIAEVGWFLVLGWPLAQAAWRWASNNPSAAQVDYLQVAVNFFALLVLAAIWIQIKELNNRLAKDLETEIRHPSTARSA